jgi:hypothetical protein
MDTTTLTRERADLLESLQIHRAFLRHTAHGLTDDQARRRPTASVLSIGGIIKHVAETERFWARFMTGADPGVDWTDPGAAEVEAYQQGFVLLPGETLAEVLAHYELVAAATDELVATLPDLDAVHPLPDAPWFPPGAVRSVRRTITHIVAETAQHAGHADIIRESIDGQRTMG